MQGSKLGTAQQVLSAVRKLKLERESFKQRVNELAPLLTMRSRYIKVCEELKGVSQAMQTMEGLLGGSNVELSSGVLDQWELRVLHGELGSRNALIITGCNA